MHRSRVLASTARFGECTGTHHISKVGVIHWQRGRQGTEAWGLKLTHTAREAVGPFIVMTMAFAAVNSKAINPPYRPHARLSSYNFHGSMRRYQLLNGRHRTQTIRTGDRLTMAWFGQGAEGSVYMYASCNIPPPGH